MATAKAPAVPAGLSKRSAQLWRDVVGEYQLSDAELEVLRCACQTLDRADQAAEVVAREGVTVVDRYGTPKAHPAVDIENRSRALFARLVAQLGVKDLDDSARPDPQVSAKARRAANARWSR